MITHTIGAILDGGSSTRMGESKARLTVEGATFLDRVYGTMCGIFDEVIVCGGDAVPQGGILVADEVEGEGPVAGLLSAFRVAEGRAVFVAAVDMPMITPEAILSLVEPVVVGASARIAVVEGRVQPLFGAYGSRVEPIARAVFDAGRRSVLRVVDDIDYVTKVPIERDEGFNVNTVEDYDVLTERYGR